MGQNTQKVWIACLIALIIPCISFAQEEVENGSSFSFKSFIDKIFSGSSSNKNTQAAPQESAASTTEQSPDVVDRLVDRFTGQPVTPTNGYQQNPAAMQAQVQQQKQIQEGLVRCMYLGKFVEVNTGLAEQDADAQIKAKRAGELYANLKCNEQLAGYEPIWKGVDIAIGNCVANDDCQNLNPAGSTLPVPQRAGNIAGTTQAPTTAQVPTSVLPTANAVGGLK